MFEQEWTVEYLTEKIWAKTLDGMESFVSETESAEVWYDEFFIKYKKEFPKVKFQSWF
jgi:hypothetical protein